MPDWFARIDTAAILERSIAVLPSRIHRPKWSDDEAAISGSVLRKDERRRDILEFMKVSAATRESAMFTSQIAEYLAVDAPLVALDMRWLYAQGKVLRDEAHCGERGRGFAYWIASGDE